MGFGIIGKIICDNLTENPLRSSFCWRRFISFFPGGKALAGCFVLKEFYADVEPFSVI
jgi:hypothetical protein